MDESTDGALGTSMPGRWLKLTQQMYIVWSLERTRYHVLRETKLLIC